MRKWASHTDVSMRVCVFPDLSDPKCCGQMVRRRLVLLEAHAPVRFCRFFGLSGSVDGQERGAQVCLAVPSKPVRPPQGTS